MSSITITIPDEFTNRVITGYCAHYAYRETIPNPDYAPDTAPAEPETIDNPQSKMEFIKAGLIQHVREAVRAAEHSSAVIAAKATVVDVEGME